VLGCSQVSYQPLDRPVTLVCCIADAGFEDGEDRVACQPAFQTLVRRLPQPVLVRLLNSLRHAPRSFESLLSDFGVVDTCVFLGKTGALQAVSGGRCRLLKYYIVAQPVPAPRDIAPRRPGGLEVRVLSRDEILAQEWPRPQHVIARRIADGSQCVAAFSKGQMIGFQGTLIGPHDERTRCVRDSCRNPPARLPETSTSSSCPNTGSGRAFMRIRDETYARLDEGGVRWTRSSIFAFALESRRSRARMQAQEVRSMRLAVPRGLTAVQPVRPATVSACWCLPSGAGPFFARWLPTASLTAGHQGSRTLNN
jgi:hypothetical protein